MVHVLARFYGRIGDECEKMHKSKRRKHNIKIAADDFFKLFLPSHTNPHVPNSCLVPVIDTYGGLKVRFPQSALLTRGALLTRIDCKCRIDLLEIDKFETLL